MSLRTVWIAPLLVLMAGCNGRSPEPQEIVLAETLQTSLHCQRTDPEPAARLLRQPEEYAQAFNELHAHKVGDAPQPPAVDFERMVVLMVEMGQRSTGGYALDLGSPEVPLNDEVARVQVDWHEPPEGRMLTQALTSPCMMMKLPRVDYRRIEVVDQQGEQRAVWQPSQD